jgi:hypothetical protein
MRQLSLLLQHNQTRMIWKQNQDHNYLRQAVGMVQKIQNQSQDHHHHQGNVVRSPMEIFGVSKKRIHDTRRIVLSRTKHPRTSEMLPWPESKRLMHESQLKFTVAAVETLYVGNLAFNTTEEDLRETLEQYLDIGTVVENVTIPCEKGKSKHSFIELSWAQATMLDIDDIMTVYSGVLKVNERRIYLRELRDKGNNQ